MVARALALVVRPAFSVRIEVPYGRFAPTFPLTLLSLDPVGDPMVLYPFPLAPPVRRRRGKHTSTFMPRYTTLYHVDLLIIGFDINPV
jgi:hypothetical protein